MCYNNTRKGTVAAVSAPLRKGVSVLMTDVILLLTFAVVLTEVNEIIKNKKRNNRPVVAIQGDYVK